MAVVVGEFPAGGEAEFCVEGDGGVIVGSDFQEERGGAAGFELGDHVIHEARAEALAAGVGMDGQGVDAAPGCLGARPGESGAPGMDGRIGLGDTDENARSGDKVFESRLPEPLAGVDEAVMLDIQYRRDVSRDS